ncbi:MULTISPECIES: bifunctional precorrin-2 dehydrogenase/sirohydrochlorin ferrochelatase [unclassified Nitratiruptor]|uniref:precorrin-2 dehydrogenase/sirohydrochlorin ferrochelatase family protein n=1 Tax=unclassified Nitratiruptor TaxID=2624044 RepID=UPI001915F3F5|nr:MULTISPECIES: bifunctional precorrin-2 dehydrogenase/sirohydrochlorin ferrochelatase [unclassified Nitratiruptor]BCD61055.1 precorrin-2 dehydrogenase / sirohydrochlorin ferrochelatase [Nitratiruptor sp. YY08-10]BCD64988.1 precorrin-2 dehydrogenase / sirohydrochlorin ferrochelatase [Nitratiruptor sp. YY08-14]
MSFFPALLKLQNRRILVIGGGKIAGDKISHLLDFTHNITIIAPKIGARVLQMAQENGLQIIQRAYQKGDVKGFFIVIVAVDDLEVQKEVFHECHQEGALCNAVDSIEYCDFIFPSYIKEGDLVIAFSTSGASPALSKYLRRAIQKLLPKDIGSFLEEIKALRQKLPKGKERMKLLDSKAKEYIQNYFTKDENVQ